MLDARLRKNLDYPLLILIVAVLTIGFVALFSATREVSTRYLQKQALALLIGLGGLVAMASIDYTRFPRLARTLYTINLGLLLFVMKFGTESKGAQRWISLAGFQFQPSEAAKLILIICLAVYLTHRKERIQEFPVLLGSFCYIAVPTFLIFRQPDLGTSLVLIAIWFGMTFIAGARWQHLTLFLLVGILAFIGMWHFNIILKDYQKNRLEAFLHPEIDPKDVGYHVIQSRIAVGSGQVWGKGFRRGTQAQGRFIPENHTDFIFTIIGEEGGFVASSILVLLFAGILLRGAITAAQADDTLGRLLAAGIVSMIAFHVIVNIGMTIGIMPVAGVPLPFVSYGGTSLMLNLTAVGLLLSIGMRRHRLMF